MFHFLWRIGVGLGVVELCFHPSISRLILTKRNRQDKVVMVQALKCLRSIFFPRELEVKNFREGLAKLFFFQMALMGVKAWWQISMSHVFFCCVRCVADQIEQLIWCHMQPPDARVYIYKYFCWLLFQIQLYVGCMIFSIDSGYPWCLYFHDGRQKLEEFRLRQQPWVPWSWHISVWNILKKLWRTLHRSPYGKRLTLWKSNLWGGWTFKTLMLSCYWRIWHRLPTWSLTIRPWKVTVWPNRKGKRLPLPPFLRGELLNFGDVYVYFFLFSFGGM